MFEKFIPACFFFKSVIYKFLFQREKVWKQNAQKIFGKCGCVQLVGC